MTEWLQALTVWDVVTVLVIAGGIIAGLRWLSPLLRGVHHFLDDWVGTPERPGVPGRPGVVAQLGALRCDIEGVKADLVQVRADACEAAFHTKPNHGTSSHDELIRRLTEIDAAIRLSVDDRAQIRQHIGLAQLNPDLDD